MRPRAGTRRFSPPRPSLARLRFFCARVALVVGGAACCLSGLLLFAGPQLSASRGEGFIHWKADSVDPSTLLARTQGPRRLTDAKDPELGTARGDTNLAPAPQKAKAVVAVRAGGGQRKTGELGLKSDREGQGLSKGESAAEHPLGKGAGTDDVQVDVSGQEHSAERESDRVQSLGRQHGLLGRRVSKGRRKGPGTASTVPPLGIRTADQHTVSAVWHREGAALGGPALQHMEDEELLWRASFVSLRDPRRHIGTRKIAFLFSFNTELFFAPLWAKFFEKHDGKFSIYLHGNGRSVNTTNLPVLFRERLVSQDNNASSSAGAYPHMYAVDAARRLVASALLDLANEWFLIVCDLCIPLHPFDYFYDYFSSSPARNFVPNQTPTWKNGLDRFLTSCFEPLILQEQWRKGGPWLGLTRRMALSLVSDVKYYDKFALCCQPIKRGPTEPCFPLEHYLATVLPILGATGTMVAQTEEVTNWSTIFEDWWTEPETGRPFVFNETLISEKLIRTMRRCHLGNLCHLQGAHFDPRTLPAMIKMSSSLGLY